MSKPFSIHDWQAKQRLLKEQKQLGLELTTDIREASLFSNKLYIEAIIL